ncbi:MAG: acyl-CoA dehydrogenase family protein [Chloroflexi bacterium]|nr:acyl-CoA dehydrogenase family protein [Chloroflexota bacterium]
MDFKLAPEDEAFRAEVRSFIQQNWDTKGFDGHSIPIRAYDFDNPDSRANDDAFTKKLIDKGWYTMHWPTEWGGTEAPLSKQFVYAEELAYANAPGGTPGSNITGALMVHGSDQIKKDFLPKMARNEVDWAQGFSEPNAGTDLANLQTRAVEDGDDFVVTGQKIWSSGSHFADWYHVLVRTDPTAPKHRGITYLIMKLKDEQGNQMPGITLRPLYDFFGRRRWNEVFMDDVRVPKSMVIGEVNRGWYAAMTTLNFERTGSAAAARHIGILDKFIALMRQTKFNGEPILSDPLVRHKLADLRVILEMDRMLGYRIAWMQSRGEVPVAEGAIQGYRNQVTAKFHFFPTLGKIIGDYSALLKGESRAPHNGIYGTNAALAMIIGFGGGGGILLGPNIIAQRGLGLPR